MLLGIEAVHMFAYFWRYVFWRYETRSMQRWERNGRISLRWRPHEPFGVGWEVIGLRA